MTAKDGQRGVTMPYGKHKGRAVADVPPAYLQWFLVHCKASEDVMETVALVLHPHLARRLAHPPPDLSPLGRKVQALAGRLAEEVERRKTEGRP